MHHDRRRGELRRLGERGVCTNAIAAGYPGKIVVFLREVANSNFAYPPDTGQVVPLPCIGSSIG